MECPDQSHKIISSECSHGCAGGKFRRRRTRRRSGGCGRRDKLKANGFVAAPVAGGGVVVRRLARKLVAGVRRSKVEVKNSGGGGLTWHVQHDPVLFRSAKEEATKWDHHYPNHEACQFHHNVKRMENHQLETTSVAHGLQIELSRVRNRVRDLETERHLFKKKLNHFLRGIAREMDAKMRRKREKMVLTVDELKGDLERERKNHQKMKHLNDSLITDLDEAKLSHKKIASEFEEEKRAREFLENVCHELGKDIQDHKANLGAVKAECARIQEEAEEERKMMQMAEVWREARVQMKLVDAKLILEEKYSQMNSLIADLETLLKSNEDVTELWYSPRMDSIKDLFHGHDREIRSRNSAGSWETKTCVMNGDCACSSECTNGVGRAPSTPVSKYHESANPSSNGTKVSSSHRCFLGRRNPHVVRVMQGCIEWPCGIQRNGVVKVKPSFHEETAQRKGS